MILSLCFVHIMPDAFSSMEGLSNYPVAGLLILAGLLLILISERVGVELLMQKQSSALESTVVVCCHSQAHHGRISNHSSVAHIHRRHAYTFHSLNNSVSGTGHACLRHSHVSKYDEHHISDSRTQNCVGTPCCHAADDLSYFPQSTTALEQVAGTTRDVDATVTAALGDEETPEEFEHLIPSTNAHVHDSRETHSSVLGAEHGHLDSRRTVRC
jgi:hypothetical protein